MAYLENHKVDVICITETYLDKWFRSNDKNLEGMSLIYGHQSKT